MNFGNLITKPPLEEVKRGEVYYIRMDNGIGAMQGAGRPGVILTSDFGCKNTPIVTVAYLTTSRKDKIVAVEVVCEKRQSWVLCNQIITVDKMMLDRKMCSLTDEEMSKVDEAVSVALGLKEFNRNEEREIEKEAQGDISLILERDTYKALYKKALEEIVEHKMRADVYKAKPTENKLNVNTAAENDFILVGFTDGMARQITTYRKRMGNFNEIGDLLKVPGIGPITLEKYESKLTV